MPYMVNGIGTNYILKRNKVTRKAVCQQCGNQSRLESYDTWLCFVVFLIPLIPLRRKHIRDQCSVCQRHFAIPAGQWHSLRQRLLGEAMDRYRSEPGDDSAADLHGVLIEFGQFDEAESFRETALSRFPDSAGLHAAAAAQLEFSGLPEDADPLWDRAAELDPEHPEVRIGMSRRLIREERLDEAREQLRFLEEPGAESQYSLEPLLNLAGFMQQAGRHEDVLEICESGLKAFPDSANHHSMRSFIARSEKALKRSDSILPDRQHSLRGLFSGQYSPQFLWTVGLAVAAVLVAVGFLINNEYVRRHRVLHVLNDTGVPASVTIDNGETVTIPKGRRTEIIIAEGDHSVRIEGPVSREVTFEAKTDYTDRWTEDPVWVLNINGEALLSDERLYYAVNPSEPSMRFCFDEFFTIPDADYIFEEAPDSMQVGSSTAVVTKRVVTWYPRESAEPFLFFQAIAAEHPAAALQFGENRLRRDPQDEALLSVWLRAVLAAGDEDRAADVLHSHLNTRPVLIEWHRRYQDLDPPRDGSSDLYTLYDELLAESPDNAAMHYLRARIDTDIEAQKELLRRAVELDPELPWPHLATAWCEAARADWESAGGHLERALASGLPAGEASGLQIQIAVGMGRTDELIQRRREELDMNPQDLGAAMQLGQILSAVGRSDEAGDIVSSCVGPLKEQFPEQMARQFAATDAVIAYWKHDAGRLKEIAGPNTEWNVLLWRCLLEQGEVAEAVQAIQAAREISGSEVAAWDLLLASCACRAADLDTDADSLRSAALSGMRESGIRAEAIVRLLESEVTPAVVSQAEQFAVDPRNKGILLTDLATRASDAETVRQLISMAEKFAVDAPHPRTVLLNVHQSLAEQAED